MRRENGRSPSTCVTQFQATVFFCRHCCKVAENRWIKGPVAGRSGNWLSGSLTRKTSLGFPPTYVSSTSTVPRSRLAPRKVIDRLMVGPGLVPVAALPARRCEGFLTTSLWLPQIVFQCPHRPHIHLKSCRYPFET